MREKYERQSGLNLSNVFGKVSREELEEAKKYIISSLSNFGYPIDSDGNDYSKIQMAPEENISIEECDAYAHEKQEENRKRK